MLFSVLQGGKSKASERGQETIRQVNHISLSVFLALCSAEEALRRNTGGECRDCGSSSSNIPGRTDQLARGER